MCLHVLTMCNSNSPILSNSSEEFQGIISWKSSLLSAKVRFVSLLTSAVFAEGLPASALTYGSYRMLILSLFCADAWTAGAFNPRHISQLGASTIIILYHSLLFQIISLSFQVEMKINPARGVMDGIFTAVWFHLQLPPVQRLWSRGEDWEDSWHRWNGHQTFCRDFCRHNWTKIKTYQNQRETWWKNQASCKVC